MKSEEYVAPKEAARVKYIVDNFPKYEKKPPSTEQCASTQAILNRPKELDEAYFNRIIKMADVKAEDIGRAFDINEVVIAENLRKDAKNQLGDYKDSSVSPEIRDKAMAGFLYTPPADPIVGYYPGGIAKSLIETKAVKEAMADHNDDKEPRIYIKLVKNIAVAALVFLLVFAAFDLYDYVTKPKQYPEYMTHPIPDDL